MRVIGDIHGDYNRYKEIINTRYSNCSIQIGDMGFDYEPLDEVNPDYHAFIGGNHDNYDDYYQMPHSAGDFGKSISPDGIEIFIVRGAYSIDYAQRKRDMFQTRRCSWWPQEELSYMALMQAAKEYSESKPQIMLTHDCPHSISKLIGNPDTLKYFGYNPDTFQTITQNALDFMLANHEPELWIFGHYHKTWIEKVGKTTFICVNMLDYIDLEDGVVYNSNGEKIASYTNIDSDS